MKTYEQAKSEAAEVAKLEVCCQKCKHFGRADYANREPSGQCQLNAPGKFSVTLVTELGFSDKLISRTAKAIESPFPGVWPWDKCGEFAAAEPVLPSPNEDQPT